MTTVVCHDGSINPPNTRNNGQPTQDPQETKPRRPLKVQRVQTVTKAPGTTRGKNNIKQLDIIHERAQAINNFRLPDGQQRLKMESRPTSKRKRGTPVEYDIHFTDLKDPKVKIHSDIPDSLSDDDLPMSIIPAPGFSQENSDEARRQGSIPDVQEPPKKRLKHNLVDSVSVIVGSKVLAVIVPVAANSKALSGKRNPIILARFRIFQRRRFY